MNNQKRVFSSTVNFQSLISQFDAKTKENDVIAYLQIASIFKYLYEEYGISRMQKLWKRGFGDFRIIYGISLSRFEKKWL